MTHIKDYGYVVASNVAIPHLVFHYNSADNLDSLKLHYLLGNSPYVYNHEGFNKDSALWIIQKENNFYVSCYPRVLSKLNKLGDGNGLSIHLRTQCFSKYWSYRELSQKCYSLQALTRGCGACNLDFPQCFYRCVPRNENQKNTLALLKDIVIKTQPDKCVPLCLVAKRDKEWVTDWNRKKGMHNIWKAIPVYLTYPDISSVGQKKPVEYLNFSNIEKNRKAMRDRGIKAGLTRKARKICESCDLSPACFIKKEKHPYGAHRCQNHAELGSNFITGPFTTNQLYDAAQQFWDALDSKIDRKFVEFVACNGGLVTKWRNYRIRMVGMSTKMNRVIFTRYPRVSANYYYSFSIEDALLLCKTPFYVFKNKSYVYPDLIGDGAAKLGLVYPKEVGFTDKDLLLYIELCQRRKMGIRTGGGGYSTRSLIFIRYLPKNSKNKSAFIMNHDYGYSEFTSIVDCMPYRSKLPVVCCKIRPKEVVEMEC